MDEDDDEEFGLNASINNHISIGSIEDQEQRLIMLAQNYGSGCVTPNYLMQFGASGRNGGLYGQDQTLERIKSSLHPGRFNLGMSSAHNQEPALRNNLAGMVYEIGSPKKILLDGVDQRQINNTFIIDYMNGQNSQLILNFTP